MGYELDRLMERYGVSTPSLAPYTGAEDSAADKATYDAYKTEYMNRMRSTPMYAAPQQPSGALAAPSATAPTASTSAPAALPTWTTPLQTPTLTTTATPAERQFQWMPSSFTLPSQYLTPETEPWYDEPSDPYHIGDMTGVRNTGNAYLSQSGYDAAVSAGVLNPNNYLFRNGQLYDKQYYAHGGSVHDLAAKYDEGGDVSLANSVSLKPLDVTTGMPSSFEDVAAKYARQPQQQQQPEAEAAPAPEAEPMPARDALYEKYSAERKEAQARAREQSAAFAKMLEGALNSPAADEASKSEMYFRLAAALGSPTKTGSFGETLGLVGSQMGEYQKTRQELEANKIKMRLEAQKYQVASAKEDVDAARAAEANYIALERENRRLEEAGKRFEKEMQLKERGLEIESKRNAATERHQLAMEILQAQKNAGSTAALSPKELQKREANYPAAQLKLKTVRQDLDELHSDIVKLANHSGLDEISGGFSQYRPAAAMTDKGKAALALYDKVIAKGGFTALMGLRSAGGTLGQVSDTEGRYLRESWAAIGRAQATKDIKAALNQTAERLVISKQNLQDAFDLTYEYRGAGSETPATIPSVSSPKASASSTTPAKKPVNFGTLKIR